MRKVKVVIMVIIWDERGIREFYEGGSGRKGRRYREEIG